MHNRKIHRRSTTLHRSGVVMAAFLDVSIWMVAGTCKKSRSIIFIHALETVLIERSLKCCVGTAGTTNAQALQTFGTRCASFKLQIRISADLLFGLYVNPFHPREIIQMSFFADSNNTRDNKVLPARWTLHVADHVLIEFQCLLFGRSAVLRNPFS